VSEDNPLSIDVKSSTSTVSGISAMKQALEALNYIYCPTTEYQDEVMEAALYALRQAIAEAEKQEPVAWVHRFIEGGFSLGKKPADLDRHPDRWQPLYAAPEDWYGQHQWQCGYERGWDAAMENRHEFECPRCGHCCQQREWVGLTDEKELWEMWVESPSDVFRFARAIEAKLKEKNT
jgi:hypothetical protein